MRKLTDHIVDGDSVNHQLTIQVIDEPGAGGANHEYLIRGYWAPGGPAIDMSRLRDVSVYPDGSVEATLAQVSFQNGPIKEAGVNGLTQEALIAITIDRMRSFQAGPFACHANAMALSDLESALGWLQQRTRERIARNVEGTHAK